MERDLTSGSVFRNVIYFSLPYFLSYFLQTLYGMADLFIVGQFDGVASTTAVSIGSQVMHMLTVMIVGLAMGATVSIGQSIGAGDKKRASVFVGNTVTLFMGISLVLLDIVMPVMNGFEVLAAMAREHWMDDIPVIMISSEGSEDYIRRAYEMGIADYIRRPFDAKIVYQRVFNTIKLYAKQRRLISLVADQIYEKEKNNRVMVGILSQRGCVRWKTSGVHSFLFDRKLR